MRGVSGPRTGAEPGGERTTPAFPRSFGPCAPRTRRRPSGRRSAWRSLWAASSTSLSRIFSTMASSARRGRLPRWWLMPWSIGLGFVVAILAMRNHRPGLAVFAIVPFAAVGWVLAFGRGDWATSGASDADERQQAMQMEATRRPTWPPQSWLPWAFCSSWRTDSTASSASSALSAAGPRCSRWRGSDGADGSRRPFRGYVRFTSRGCQGTAARTKVDGRYGL